MKPKSLLVLLALPLAGCSAAASADPPEPTPSVYTTSFFTGLTGECPDLTSSAASELGVAGRGEPTRDHAGESETRVVADCAWTSEGLDVSARISVHRVADAALADWQVVSAGQDRRMLEVGEEAYSAVEMPALVVRARSGTAVATIRFTVEEDVATEEYFEELRPAATEISNDVLDDLT